MAVNFFKSATIEDKDSFSTPLDAPEITRRLNEQMNTSRPHEFYSAFKDNYTEYKTTSSGFEIRKKIPGSSRGFAMTVIITGDIVKGNNGSTVTLYCKCINHSSILFPLALLIIYILVIGIVTHAGAGFYIPGMIPMLLYVLAGGVSKKYMRSEMYMLFANVRQLITT